MCQQLRLHVFASCLCGSSWQSLGVSHHAIIHKDYSKSYEESVSEPWLHLTWERSDPLGMGKWSSSEAQRGESWRRDTTTFISFHPRNRSSPLSEKLFVPVRNSLLFSCDHQSLSPPVPELHTELDLVGRWQEPFLSQRGAEGDERGTRFLLRHISFWLETCCHALYRLYSHSCIFGISV